MHSSDAAELLIEKKWAKFKINIYYILVFSIKKLHKYKVYTKCTINCYTLVDVCICACSTPCITNWKTLTQQINTAEFQTAIKKNLSRTQRQTHTHTCTLTNTHTHKL